MIAMMEYWASLLSDFQALSPTGKLGFVVGIAGVSLWSLTATVFGFFLVRGRNYRKVAQRLADELAMLETRLDEAHADLAAQRAEREQFEPHRWMEAAALEEADGREEQAVLLVEDGVTRVRTAFAASMTLLAGHYLSRIVGPEAERHLQNGLYYARAAASLDTDNREAAFLLEEALLEQGVGPAAVAQAPASFLPYDQAEAKQIIRAIEERAAPLIQAGRYRLAVRLYRRGELVVERARLHRTVDGWLMIFRLTQARMLAQESRAAAKTIDALLEASEAISGRHGSEMLKARVLEASLRQQMGDHAYSLKLIDEILVPLEALEGQAGPNVVVARLTGVKACASQGDCAQALIRADELLALTPQLGANDRNLLLATLEKARILDETGDHQAAAALLEAVDPRFVAAFGTDHLQTLIMRVSKAVCAAKSGQQTNALADLNGLIAQLEENLGSLHSSTLSARHNAAWILFKSEAYGPALAAIDDLLIDRARIGEPDLERDVAAKQLRAQILLAMGRASEALAICKEFDADADHMFLNYVRLVEIEALAALGRQAEAEILLASLVAAVTTLMPTHPLRRRVWEVQDILRGDLAG